ncbi:Glycerol-3-phosphate acyltransferase [hydrothermal vent metagenome]|uniref:Glycerol-3-phosphate acyltransferase n=1 Tax=hydrothermal vent metagenome TaxID=652676 RepID=A0A3B0SXF9_9ZZZZ
MAERSTPQWPDKPGPYVALIDASSNLEAELINDWIQECCGPRSDPIDRFRIPPSRRRRPFGNVDPSIGERLHREDDPLCIPMRVVWLAPERDGRRRVRLIDVLKPGDPRDPNVVTQRIILKRHPDQCRIVIGAPARRSDLEKRWSQPSGRGPADGTTLGEFVALQAWLSLERAERSIRGQRYKVPKFLREDLFWSRPFQAGVERLARDSGRPVKRVKLRTARYLKEIAAQHSPYVIDIVNGITSTLIATAHHSVVYSARDLHDIYRLAEDYPLVFLPSHKSNFDHLVFQHVLYENELPLNHTAGGINMNFFLVGPLLRRSGIFFIRREFKNNEPYKFVLRQYLDYLLEKRFALEWYIEGGRSRSGKLREPRLGLLKYVADSYQRGIADDVILVPVSINYDQISDVSSYAAEQRGRSKDRESLLWAIKFIAGLRRRNGSIHIRFGEPLFMSTRVGRTEDLTSDAGRLTLPKVAFEISTRINDVTPITPISLVTLALLSREERGFTALETIEVLRPFEDFVAQRNLPTTFELPFTSSDQVADALDALAENGVVRRTEGLTETIYSIGSDQHLAAAYYRNTIIHFFVNAGITEVALGTGILRNRSMHIDAVIERALALRDLLKFEFFFSPSGEFADEIRDEISRYEIGELSDALIDVDMETMRPAKSPMVLRPFLEAYLVVSHALCSFNDEPVEADELRNASLAMGEQLLQHGILSTSEAVSTTLFTSGIQLADNRGLLSGTDAQRQEFRRELTSILDVLSDIADFESF